MTTSVTSNAVDSVSGKPTASASPASGPTGTPVVRETIQVRTISALTTAPAR